jgi:hypothetical protein
VWLAVIAHQLAMDQRCQLASCAATVTAEGVLAGEMRQASMPEFPVTGHGGLDGEEVRAQTEHPSVHAMHSMRRYTAFIIRTGIRAACQEQTHWAHGTHVQCQRPVQANRPSTQLPHTCGHHHWE